MKIKDPQVVIPLSELSALCEVADNLQVVFMAIQNPEPALANVFSNALSKLEAFNSRERSACRREAA